MPLLFSIYLSLLSVPPQIAETREQAVVIPEMNMDKEAGKERGGK